MDISYFINLVLIGAIVVSFPLGALILFLRRLSLRKKMMAGVEDGSVLLAYTLKGSIINGANAETPGGIPYTHILGLNKGFGIYSVELPFKSGAHLLGLPKGSSVLLSIEGPLFTMDPVELEGDYVNYFNLYADYGQAAQTQYVLDPSAMVFTVDFCQTYNWEIDNDTLYIMSHGPLPSLEIVDQFVKDIRPALEIKSDGTHDPAKLPYLPASDRTLLCPICNTKLTPGLEWMECPNGHGALTTGGQLAEIRHEEFDGDEETIPVVDRNAIEIPHGQIKCPYCGHDMNPTQYQTTDTIIDVCSKCMYRWLDTGELKAILGRNR